MAVMAVNESNVTVMMEGVISYWEVVVVLIVSAFVAVQVVEAVAEVAVVHLPLLQLFYLCYVCGMRICLAPKKRRRS